MAKDGEVASHHVNVSLGAIVDKYIAPCSTEEPLRELYCQLDICLRPSQTFADFVCFFNCGVVAVRGCVEAELLVTGDSIAIG